MEINTNALIEQLQYQKTAILFYKNAGLITEKEYQKIFNNILKIERLHDKATMHPEAFKDGIVITTRYSL